MNPEPQVIAISAAADHLGRPVAFQGWVRRKRSSGKIRFLILRDGTGIVQGILDTGKAGAETVQAFDQLTVETSLRVTGILQADSRAPGGVELEIRTIRIFQIAEDFPITPKEHGTAFLMAHRHLWLRSSRQQAIQRIRHELSREIRNFLNARDFIELDAPILTANACEGTSTLFETRYFDQGSAYLSQSGQLYMEAGAMAFGRVYCFGPAFRAEKSKTRRHLTEFWMVEPEWAFGDLEAVMSLVEDLVIQLVRRTLEFRLPELELLERDLTGLKCVAAPFPRLSYSEAVATLQDKGFPLSFGDDLGGDEETALASLYDRPVFIHRYPAACKAFYMKQDPADPRLVLNMDLLAPEGYGEIVGGSQREDDLQVLRKRLAAQGLAEAELDWYLDLRRYGSVPHGGFGLGLERVVAWICGLAHVREAIPFPRTLYRLYP
ncbi:MAG: asparagine--tRNA ligase [Deltaproteobacteria bacterium]|nr:asparagine--tRNA ligase [Deltaproteobacteria bacterium]